MQKLAILTIALLAAVTAPIGATHANSGADYTVEHLLKFEVAGLRLGMPAAEAAKVLTESNYEGSYEKKIGDDVKAWVQVDRVVFPSRYVAPDGSVKLWRIRFGQRFDVKVSKDVIRAKLVEKYGEPSKVDNSTGELVWEAPWSFSPGTAAVCMASGDPGCWRMALVGTKFKSGEEFEATYNAEAYRPQLRADIRPDVLYVTLSHTAAKVDADAQAKQMANDAEEAKRRKAASKIDLGL